MSRKNKSVTKQRNKTRALNRAHQIRAKERRARHLKQIDRWEEVLDLRPALGIIHPGYRWNINRIARSITPEQLARLLVLLDLYGPVIPISQIDYSLLRLLSKDQYYLRLGRESWLTRFIRLDNQEWDSISKVLTKYEVIKEQMQDWYLELEEEDRYLSG